MDTTNPREHLNETSNDNVTYKNHEWWLYNIYKFMFLLISTIFIPICIKYNVFYTILKLLRVRK
jgi:hypothetical protein